MSFGHRGGYDEMVKDKENRCIFGADCTMDTERELHMSKGYEELIHDKSIINIIFHVVSFILGILTSLLIIYMLNR